jgi:hypothetical protein
METRVKVMICVYNHQMALCMNCMSIYSFWKVDSCLNFQRVLS